MNFQLGGISIPIEAGLEFSQVYESFGGSVIQRMQSGKAVKQTHFRKLRTTLSGQGWLPTGLDALDYTGPLLLKCAAPRSIASQNNQLTIPAQRRNDSPFEPKGFALVDGHLVETGTTIKTDIAILEKISTALSYHLHYYPEILVFAEPPQLQGNMTAAEFSWSLTCEEV